MALVRVIPCLDIKDGRVVKLEITSTVGGRLQLVSPWETIRRGGEVLEQDAHGLITLDTKKGETLVFRQDS